MNEKEKRKKKQQWEKDSFHFLVAAVLLSTSDLKNHQFLKTI